MRTDIFKIINITLGLCILFALALLARQLLVLRYKPRVMAGIPAVNVEGEGMKTDKEFSRYEAIASGGLFGRGKLQLIDIGAHGEGTPVSTGEITLIGTAVGTSGRGYAIFLGKQSKKQEIFGKGDAVYNIGTLTAVEEYRVLINSQGSVLTFYIPEYEPPHGKAGNTGAGSKNTGAVFQKTGESDWIIDQGALNNVLNDMAKVLTDARLLPYSENGKIAGFRLSEVRPDGVFALIGLKDGDILLKVNDFEIDSPEKGVQLLNGLRGESSVRLDIVRGNERKRLNYQIR